MPLGTIHPEHELRVVDARQELLQSGDLDEIWGFVRKGLSHEDMLLVIINLFNRLRELDDKIENARVDIRF